MVQEIKKSTYIELLNRVSKVLEEARQKTVKQVNTVMVETYWQIGRLIVEEEQRGKERAEYGEELIKKLSNDLTKKFGEVLQPQTCGICVSSFRPIQNSTQCVENLKMIQKVGLQVLRYLMQ